MFCRSRYTSSQISHISNSYIFPFSSSVTGDGSTTQISSQHTPIFIILKVFSSRSHALFSAADINSSPLLSLRQTINTVPQLLPTHTRSPGPQIPIDKFNHLLLSALFCSLVCASTDMCRFLRSIVLPLLRLG